jgi:hypothetical protein
MVNKSQEVIGKIRNLTTLIEKHSKALATQDVVKNIVLDKEWRDTAKSFAHKISSGRGSFDIKISLKNYKKVKAFKHSQTGGQALVQSDYVLNQSSESDIRNGRRWIDLLPTEMMASRVQLNKYFMTDVPGINWAAIAAEGDPKPLREKQITPQTYTFTKIAVTDLVTQEALYALPNEQLGDFLLEALLEHVYDVLERELANYLHINAAPFTFLPNYLTYGLNPPSATWHDLIAAAQRAHELFFVDHFVGEKFANLMVTGPHTLTGILQDRHSHQQVYLSNEHAIDSWPQGKDFVWWSRANQIVDAFNAIENAILLNTNNWTLIMLDAAEVYFERVADRTDERNLYRLVAEVYYMLVPNLIHTRPGAPRPPVLRIDNTLSTRNSL